VRLVFAGTPETAVPSLNAILESSHELVAVISRPDARSGRGKRLHPSPVTARAQEAGLEVLRPARLSDPALLDRLTELAPDCCPVVAYGALIPRRMLALPQHGWINLHFSLLPRWRGAAPVQHAIMNGDSETGASTFAVVRQMDAGPVYAVVTQPVSSADTAGTLLDRIAISGAQLLVDTLDGVAAGAWQPTAQHDADATTAPKVTVNDARIDWAARADQIDRQVRGCNPAPGAWTLFRGEHFKINSATPDGRDDLEPGQLEIGKHAIRVGTGSSSLLLDQVQPPGKRPMPAADWARGNEFRDGERLGS
jgi:methionyl-tRNA formyltransferase